MQATSYFNILMRKSDNIAQFKVIYKQGLVRFLLPIKLYLVFLFLQNGSPLMASFSLALYPLCSLLNILSVKDFVDVNK